MDLVNSLFEVEYDQWGHISNIQVKSSIRKRHRDVEKNRRKKFQAIMTLLRSVDPYTLPIEDRLKWQRVLSEKNHVSDALSLHKMLKTRHEPFKSLYGAFYHLENYKQALPLFNDNTRILYWNHQLINDIIQPSSDICKQYAMDLDTDVNIPEAISMGYLGNLESISPLELMDIRQYYDSGSYLILIKKLERFQFLIEKHFTSFFVKTNKFWIRKKSIPSKAQVDWIDHFICSWDILNMEKGLSKCPLRSVEVKETDQVEGDSLIIATFKRPSTICIGIGSDNHSWQLERVRKFLKQNTAPKVQFLFRQKDINRLKMNVCHPIYTDFTIMDVVLSHLLAINKKTKFLVTYM